MKIMKNLKEHFCFIEPIILECNTIAWKAQTQYLFLPIKLNLYFNIFSVDAISIVHYASGQYIVINITLVTEPNNWTIIVSLGQQSIVYGMVGWVWVQLMGGSLLSVLISVVSLSWKKRLHSRAWLKRERERERENSRQGRLKLCEQKSFMWLLLFCFRDSSHHLAGQQYAHTHTWENTYDRSQ